MAAPIEASTIISIGYEQRSVDDLIAALQRHDVSVLVDVRMNPISRKKGFSKTALANALATALRTHSAIWPNLLGPPG